MSLQFIGSNSDLNSVIAQMNANILELKNQESTKITKDDTGTRRVLQGKGADGFYGMKVSQEGVDVYSAEDDELVFNSDNNLFKIVQTGTLEVIIPDASQSGAGTVTETNNYTVPHSVGYPPVFVAFFFSSGINTQLIPYHNISFSGSDAMSIKQVLAQADSTQLIFDTYNRIQRGSAGTSNVAGNTGTIRYYILQETAN